MWHILISQDPRASFEQSQTKAGKGASPERGARGVGRRARREYLYSPGWKTAHASPLLPSLVERRPTPRALRSADAPRERTATALALCHNGDGHGSRFRRPRDGAGSRARQVRRSRQGARRARQRRHRELPPEDLEPVGREGQRRARRRGRGEGARRWQRRHRSRGALGRRGRRRARCREHPVLRSEQDGGLRVRVRVRVS